jgi:hypothetical protein
MSSSKFSSPFFQKSPLRGAYSSGADGMVTVSYDDVHQKFQDGIAENVAKSYSKKNDPCSDPNTVQYTENSVLKKCPKKTSISLAGVKEFNRISDAATIAEEQDNMDDINSTEDFLESEKKKDAAELKRIKKEKQKKSIESMNTYFRNEMEKQAYIESKK